MQRHNTCEWLHPWRMTYDILSVSKFFNHNRSKTPLYENIIYCEGTKDGVEVEVAMQHNDSYARFLCVHDSQLVIADRNMDLHLTEWYAEFSHSSAQETAAALPIKGGV